MILLNYEYFRHITDLNSCCNNIFTNKFIIKFFSSVFEQDVILGNMCMGVEDQFQERKS